MGKPNEQLSPETRVAAFPHPDASGSVDHAASPTMDLSGTGKSFMWFSIPTVITMLGQVFLVAFSVRTIGSTEYGGVVTIVSAVAVLTLASGALRYAVVRTGAGKVRATTNGTENALDSIDSILAAHSVFAISAVALVIIGAALGWVIPLDVGARGTEASRLYVSAVLFACSSAILFAVGAYSGVLTSKEKFGTVARVSLIGFGVQAGMTILLANSLLSIGLGLAALGGALTQAGLLIHHAKRLAPWLRVLPVKPAWPTLAPVLRYGGHSRYCQSPPPSAHHQTPSS